MGSLGNGNTDGELRAVLKSQRIDPQTVERYWGRKFGDSLPEARKATRELAGAFDPEELGLCGFGLYEQFRPKIPEGVRPAPALWTQDPAPTLVRPPAPLPKRPQCPPMELEGYCPSSRSRVEGAYRVIFFTVLRHPTQMPGHGGAGWR